MALITLVHTFEFLVGCGVLLFIYMVIEAKQSNIWKIDHALSELTQNFDGFTLYFVSDVHRRRLSQRMLMRIARVDLVVIGGDLVEHNVPFERMDQNLKRLKKLGVPIVFVWGNHDLQVDPYRFRATLKANDIQILTNDSLSIERGSERLNIIGVHDATNDLDCLELAIHNAKSGPRILVSHNPDIVDKIASRHRIPLVISGHTHGGQIRLLGWGIREKGGIKKKPFGTLIISNGYGTTRYPLRLGARPNTILLKLRCNQG